MSLYDAAREEFERHHAHLDLQVNGSDRVYVDNDTFTRWGGFLRGALFGADWEAERQFRREAK